MVRGDRRCSVRDQARPAALSPPIALWTMKTFAGCAPESYAGFPSITRLKRRAWTRMTKGGRKSPWRPTARRFRRCGRRLMGRSHGLSLRSTQHVSARRLDVGSREGLTQPTSGYVDSGPAFVWSSLHSDSSFTQFANNRWPFRRQASANSWVSDWGNPTFARTNVGLRAKSANPDCMSPLTRGDSPSMSLSRVARIGRAEPHTRRASRGT